MMNARKKAERGEAKAGRFDPGVISNQLCKKAVKDGCTPPKPARLRIESVHSASRDVVADQNGVAHGAEIGRGLSNAPGRVQRSVSRSKRRLVPPGSNATPYQLRFYGYAF
jgi:hypothetical protein